MIRLPQLGSDPNSPFPPLDSALAEPDGLLAFGGDLSPQRLLNAYSQGIFPWYSDDQPILWWSPDPRMLLAVSDLRVSRSLRKFLRRTSWRVSIDQAFDQVIFQCASRPRRGQCGTWITDEMREAYCQLHAIGAAHSVEVWSDDQLVGGIYGVALGQFFFGESMFSIETNGSKTAITALCRALEIKGMRWLDGQLESDHLSSLGFRPRSRTEFELALRQNPAHLVALHTVPSADIQPAALAKWSPEP